MTILLPLIIPFVSDRLHFEDPDVMSQYTQQKMVNLSTKVGHKLSLGELFSHVAGAKVLVLIHGYNKEYESVLSMYEPYINKLRDSYDIIIGYLWPGGDHGFEYFSAKERVVRELDLRLLSFLAPLKGIAKSVDILAHSMGCRLSLEALEMASGKIVRNLFLTAAAVDNESIETNEQYYDATHHCENVFVFYSRQDEVLKYLYLLSEGDRALGYSGPEDSANLPANVQIFDVSKEVSYHGDYRNEDIISEKIQELSGSIPIESRE